MSTTPPASRPEGREVQLLPRHWAWLASQPRSASASLRRLVEAALRDRDGSFARDAARERCYVFLFDHAGDRPGFEAACRALYAEDATGFTRHAAAWPDDVRREAEALAAEVWPHSAVTKA